MFLVGYLSITVFILVIIVGILLLTLFTKTCHSCSQCVTYGQMIRDRGAVISRSLFNGGYEDVEEPSDENEQDSPIYNPPQPPPANVTSGEETPDNISTTADTGANATTENLVQSGDSATANLVEIETLPTMSKKAALTFYKDQIAQLDRVEEAMSRAALLEEDDLTNSTTNDGDGSFTGGMKLIDPQDPELGGAKKKKKKYIGIF